MEQKKLDIAISIIKPKIAKEFKENKEHDYNALKSKILKLREEEREAYRQNEEVINKILSEYAKEVKTGNK